MASWCRQQGVDLAPHVKTTMSAPIIARQVASGAAGVTVATVDQAGSALEWGPGRFGAGMGTPARPHRQ
jgi:D-serine deaminase-like pyridoxal phosphate-dependent protein